MIRKKLRKKIRYTEREKEPGQKGDRKNCSKKLSSTRSKSPAKVIHDVSLTAEHKNRQTIEDELTKERSKRKNNFFTEMLRVSKSVKNLFVGLLLLQLHNLSKCKKSQKHFWRLLFQNFTKTFISANLYCKANLKLVNSCYENFSIIKKLQKIPEEIYLSGG